MTVKLGLDVHAADIVVCRQDEGLLPKPARRMRWAEFLEWVRALVQSGARVHSCYEAGPCGYGLHRALTALGVHNLVVVPQRWDEQGQRVKTDKRDARELCDRLERYLRGNPRVFAVVRVPTVEQEQQRALGRQRSSLVKNRQRCVVRGHGLMLAQGIQAEPGWWEPQRWPQWREQLPEWLREIVEPWQQQAQRLEEEIGRWSERWMKSRRRLVQRISRSMPAPLASKPPPGIAPGAMALTRMPCGPSALASSFITMVWPAFAAQGKGAITPRDFLFRVGNGAGLSNAEIQTCITNPDTLKASEARAEAAFKAGVTGTPAFFVNDTQVITPGGEGASMADLTRAIDAELAK